MPQKSGLQREIAHLKQQLAELQRFEQVRQKIMTAAAANRGQQYFNRLAVDLAESLGADAILISVRCSDSPARAKTLAFFCNDRLQESLLYALADTPCGKVLKNGLGSYPAGVCSSFPKDQRLIDHRIEAYIGIPLFSANKQPIGLIAAMYRAPQGDPLMIENTLRLLSDITATEILQRQRREEQQRLQLASQQLTRHIRQTSPTAPTETFDSEEVLFAILETLPNPVFYKDNQGIYTGCNRAFCDYLGREREQIVGHSVFDIAPADLAKIYHESDLKMMQQHGQECYEAKVRYADGSHHDILFNKSTIGALDGPVKGLVGIMTDITELNNFKQFLSGIINSVPDPIFVKDQQHRFVLLNQNFCALLGIPHQQLLGQSEYALFPKEQAWVTREKDAEVFTSGQVKIDQEELSSADGQTRYLETKKSIFIAPSGEQYLVGCIRDITNIREAELRAEQLRDMLRNIIDSMPSILVTVDPQGLVTQWNAEAEKLTGLNQSAATGRQLAEIFPALKQDLENIPVAIQTGKPQGVHKARRELAGQKLRVDLTIYPLLTSGTRGAVIRIDNVTDVARMEDLLVQSEKMLSLGGLAAGMAHEINNPLAGILQNLQLVRNRLLQDSPANRRVAQENGCDLELVQRYITGRDIPDMLEMIQEAGHRAAAIVQNMLSFSRKGSDDLLPCHLDQIIIQAIEIARNDYNLAQNYDFRRVLIDYQKDPDLPPIQGIETQLQQVLFNLFKNSAQAMAGWQGEERQPKITIRTRLVQNSVQVNICENGPGLPESLRKKIFEPFFTTKEVGQGTGLGLSVSYFIIKETHKGSLSVNSEPGQGTCFQISLPARFEDGFYNI